MTTPTTDTRSTTLQDGGDAATTVTMNMFMLVAQAARGQAKSNSADAARR